jgi:NAD(P)-dependent dehydrogenase (short-subunit alcohol dehydrogenase family)
MSDQQNAQASFPRRLEGRTVLVTGAGTGFGAEIAVRAAQEGAHVVVHYNRSREGAEQTAKRIEQTGGQATLVHSRTQDLAQAGCGVDLGDTDFQRRHDRFVSDQAYRRLAAVRATWDPDGVFCSYLGGAAGELNRHA